MSSPDNRDHLADHKPLTTDQLIDLVGTTRKKVAAAATDLETLSRELRRRLGLSNPDGGQG